MLVVDTLKGSKAIFIKREPQCDVALIYLGRGFLGAPQKRRLDCKYNTMNATVIHGRATLEKCATCPYDYKETFFGKSSFSNCSNVDVLLIKLTSNERDATPNFHPMPRRVRTFQIEIEEL